MGAILILAIITAIRDEEERNFIEDLYIKHGKTMWKYAMYLTKNTSEADELIQISFEKIIKYIDSVKKINCCKIDSYMVSIVRNSYNTMLLKKYKEKDVIEYTDFDEISEYIGATDDYEDILENSGSADIMSALEHMPDNYKMVLKLKYIYEFDDEQIAQAIGVKSNSIRMYKTRALRILADRLKGSEDIEFK